MSYPDSFYAASAALAPVRAAATGELRADVCIIGGGFTGLSAALELAQRGVDVVLLEGARIGWGASGRNGGQICTGYSVEPVDLVDRFGQEAARDLFVLSEEGKEIIEARGIDCDRTLGYVFAAKKPSAIKELEDRAEALDRLLGQDPGQMLDKEALNARLLSPRYVGGHFDATAGHLHPLKYAIGLADLAEQAGARLFERSAVKSVTKGRVETDRATILADKILLATNGYSSLKSLSVSNQVLPVTSYIGATAPLSPEEIAQTIPQLDAICEYSNILNYFRIAPTGQMIFGAGASYSGRDPKNLDGFVRKEMAKSFPWLASKPFAHLWQGNIGITLDRIPSVGDDGAGIYHALGFSGQGVSLTGVAGRLIAEAMTGDDRRYRLLADISHHAFPGGRLLRAEIQALAMMYYRLQDMIH